MNTALVDLFRHNLWANARLLDGCIGLSDEVLHSSVIGTYGEIGATLRHLVLCEEGYLHRLNTSQRMSTPEAETGLPDVAQLRDRALRSGQQLIDVTQQFQAGQLCAVDWEDGSVEQIPAEIYLAQAITHAAEHRSQVATILTQQGIEPPDVSVWAWCDEVIFPESRGK